MDFAYTPAQQELKARAAAYAELLMGYEDEAERAGGPLPKERSRNSPGPRWTPVCTASTCRPSGAAQA